VSRWGNSALDRITLLASDRLMMRLKMIGWKRPLADSPFNRWRSHRRLRLGLVPVMVTGAQIREARSRLGWSAQQLANRAHVPEPTVKRAERSSGEAAITLDQERKIRAAFLAVGMRLNDHRLRSAG